MNTHSTMISRQAYSIFRKGSRTYFSSSLFFPADIQSDVFTLYSFVRTADDFVDRQPSKPRAFFAFRKEYETALKGTPTHTECIQRYIELAHRRKFDPAWTMAFLDAMESDLRVKRYQDFAATKKYMYGSAEVIGLMMAAIMGLPPSARTAAKLLGRSMQYVNFIRDIAEDLELGRNYFPITEMKKFGLESLDPSTTSKNPEAFSRFLTAQLEHYQEWRTAGEKGFSAIPRRYRIAVKTANDLYCWTAEQIAKNPRIVYEKKVKPSTIVIARTVLKNLLFSL